MSRTPLHPARLLLVIGLPALCLGAPSGPAGGPGGEDENYGNTVLPLLQRHCARCHGREIQRGGFDLTAYPDEASALADPERWRLIGRRVADGTMPPGEQSVLGEGERETFVGWIEASFSAGELTILAVPGRPVLRRLNRTEYHHTIRDLYGLDFPADELFPSDGVGHGFDTSGDALSMPDSMFEKYLDAAEWIAARAIAAEEPGPPPARRFGPGAFDGAGRSGDDGWLFYSGGGAGFTHEFPLDGEYLVRASAWAQQAGPEMARMRLAVGPGPGAEEEVLGERGEPSTHELQVRVSAGPHRVEARFVNDYYDPDHPDPRQRDRNLVVRWLEIVGPLDPPPIGDFQRELFARFGEEPGISRLERIVESLAFRAWRRPVTTAELERLVDLARDEEGLEARVRLTLTAILASPHFLFRPEPDLPRSGVGEVRDLDGFELATRLSYFLWSSAPDAALLEAARRGDLADEAGLLAAVARLLADPRSTALASGFAAQWLQMRVLERVAVDEELFPDFDEALRESMRTETLFFFDRLFRGGEDSPQAAERRQRRRSVLDFVLADAKRLRQNLDEEDRRKLDEYLSGVREVERRIEFAEEQYVETVPDSGRPEGIPRDFGEHVRLLADLIVLALRTDSTRIVTLLVANEGSNRPYRNLGIADGHHTLSHHGNDPQKQRRLADINRYHVEQLAHLLRGLDAVREGEGTLLDSTAIVYGSAIRDGNRHDHDDLPILLLGDRGTGVELGAAHRWPKNTPLTNLHLTLLEHFGARTATLGDATGMLSVG